MADQPPSVPTPSLTQRTYAGLQWTYLQTAVSSVLHIAMAAVLGRLLTPSAFGLLALANLVLRFVNYFARAGVSQAVVQKADLSEDDVRAAFSVSLGLGAAFVVVAVTAAPFAGSVFDEPDLVPVLRAMSAALLISAFGATAKGLLRREMRFRAMAVISIGSYLLAYAVVGVGLAIAGAGVWALVAATLTQTLVDVVSSYVLARHRVRPTRSRASYRAIFGFGSRVSVIGFFEFLGDELDTLAVGRYAGVNELGLYNRGYTLVAVPMYQLKEGLGKVLFPALSSIQTDVRRLRRAYLDAVGMAAAIGLPISAGIAVASDEIILVVLGPQWTEAAQVVPWLALAAASSLLAHFGGVMAEVQGSLNIKLVVVVSKLAVLAGLLLFAAGGPVSWYGAALAGAAVYVHLVYVAFMSRSLDVGPMTILAQSFPPVLAAGIVAAALSAVRWPLVAIDAPDAVTLVAQILVGAVVLALCFRFGPLRTIAGKLSDRLEHVGLLRRDGSIWRRGVARTLRAVLGAA